MEPFPPPSPLYVCGFLLWRFGLEFVVRSHRSVGQMQIFLNYFVWKWRLNDRRDNANLTPPTRFTFFKKGFLFGNFVRIDEPLARKGKAGASLQWAPRTHNFLGLVKANVFGREPWSRGRSWVRIWALEILCVIFHIHKFAKFYWCLKRPIWTKKRLEMAHLKIVMICR